MLTTYWTLPALGLAWDRAAELNQTALRLQGQVKPVLPPAALETSARSKQLLTDCRGRPAVIGPLPQALVTADKGEGLMGLDKLAGIPAGPEPEKRGLGRTRWVAY